MDKEYLRSDDTVSDRLLPEECSNEIVNYILSYFHLSSNFTIILPFNAK